MRRVGSGLLEVAESVRLGKPRWGWGARQTSPNACHPPRIDRVQVAVSHW